MSLLLSEVIPPSKREYTSMCAMANGNQVDQKLFLCLWECNQEELHRQVREESTVDDSECEVTSSTGLSIEAK